MFGPYVYKRTHFLLHKSILELESSRGEQDSLMVSFIKK